MNNQFNYLDDPEYTKEDAAYDYKCLVSFGAINEDLSNQLRGQGDE